MKKFLYALLVAQSSVLIFEPRSFPIAIALVAICTLIFILEERTGDHVEKEQVLCNSLLEANKVGAEILELRKHVADLDEKISQMNTKMNGVTLMLGGTLDEKR